MLGRSPTPVVTTGSPEAKASSTEIGWLSTTEELTKMSASSYSLGIADGSIRPTNLMPVDPSDAASCRSSLFWLPEPAIVRVASLYCVLSIAKAMSVLPTP